MKTTIIGAGNVGSHLAKALDSSDHTICEVYSQNKKNAVKLCKNLFLAEPTDSLDFSKSKAELFFICVPDDAIADVVENIILPSQSLLVHTSGSVPLEVLTSIHFNCGVFYPLQTFSKDKPVDFKNIPICIESSNPEIDKKLEKVALSISDNVCYYNSEDRKWLHLAAVFACNFTNHMLTLSEKLCDQQEIAFGVLKPLIEETIEKAFAIGPSLSQTGPASRQDHEVIKKQIQMLDGLDQHTDIYKLVTESIINTQKN